MINSSSTIFPRMIQTGYPILQNGQRVLMRMIFYLDYIFMKYQSPFGIPCLLEVLVSF